MLAVSRSSEDCELNNIYYLFRQIPSVVMNFTKTIDGRVC
jgi:hypothetical protein